LLAAAGNRLGWIIFNLAHGGGGAPPPDAGDVLGCARGLALERHHQPSDF